MILLKSNYFFLLVQEIVIKISLKIYLTFLMLLNLLSIQQKLMDMNFIF